jgi:NAD(P)H-nitrite reductase large subunit
MAVLLNNLVAPAWEQAQVLADRLACRDSQAVYHGSQVATRLKVMGVELTVMGEKEPDRENDEVVTYTEPSRGIYKKLIVRNGYLAGAILLGDSLTAPRLLQVFDRGEALPENRADLLFPLAGESKALNVTDLPDTAQVYNCNGVSKGKIIGAVKAGHRSLESVCDTTRAGTGCGSCKPHIQALLELASDGLVVNDPPYRVPVHG